MTLRVAIVGRPNVGKSTLFNRLVGRRAAIVDPEPGLTRDRHVAEARLGGCSFLVADTPGLEEAESGSLGERMLRQAESALDEADLVLFVTDGRRGIVPLDREFANLVRARAAEVLVLVNKCDTPALAGAALEAHELGLGEPLAVSAEHGLGMTELGDFLAGFRETAEESAPPPEDALRLAVVGRPNSGKSTLVNRLLGEERMLTGPEPGITRDAVLHPWTWKGRPVELVDTAGLRRRARVRERPEAASAEATRRAIRFAEVVLLMLDCNEALVDQDFGIAREVVEEGRALVIAANKWDLVRRPDGVRRVLALRLRDTLPQVRGIRAMEVSARTGFGVDRLMEEVFDVRRRWSLRVPTAKLNQWLAGRVEEHPPPRAGGRAQRLRYITQVNVRPPTFALFANHPKALPRTYLRYLANGLGGTFGLDGVPIRIMVRKGENPYAGKGRA